MLLDRLEAEKIYLIGHSWGSIIGILVTQQRPDLYYAFTSSGQMVDVLESDQMILCPSIITRKTILMWPGSGPLLSRRLSRQVISEDIRGMKNRTQAVLRAKDIRLK